MQKRMIRMIISLEDPQMKYLQQRKKETGRSYARIIRDFIDKEIR